MNDLKDRLNKVELRRLTTEHLEAILEINLQHKKLMGIQKRSSYDDGFDQTVPLYFLDPDRYILGAFFEGKLISYMAVILWKNFPCWTFAHAKATRFWSGATFQPQLNGIADLISKILQDEMRNGRSAYWFLTSKKRSEGHRNYWSLSVPELMHYRFISRTIEKSYRPQSILVWELMGKQLWEEDLVIRIGVEKSKEESLRPFFKLLQIDDLSDPSIDQDTGAVIRC